jgi:hypothetical protein
VLAGNVCLASCILATLRGYVGIGVKIYAFFNHILISHTHGFVAFIGDKSYTNLIIYIHEAEEGISCRSLQAALVYDFLCKNTRFLFKASYNSLSLENFPWANQIQDPPEGDRVLQKGRTGEDTGEIYEQGNHALSDSKRRPKGTICAWLEWEIKPIFPDNRIAFR